MPENIQNEALGKGKAAIWRKARLEGRAPFTVRDLLSQKGRPLTLNELGRRYDPHFIEPAVDTMALKGARFQQSKLKSKFKHAGHFGLNPKLNNRKTQKQFADKLVEFMNDKQTEYKINSQYRNVEKSKVYYNKGSNIVVVFREDNSFLTTLQLVRGDKQYIKFINDGILW